MKQGVFTKTIPSQQKKTIPCGQTCTSSTWVICNKTHICLLPMPTAYRLHTIHFAPEMNNKSNLTSRWSPIHHSPKQIHGSTYFCMTNPMVLQDLCQIPNTKNCFLLFGIQIVLPIAFCQNERRPLFMNCKRTSTGFTTWEAGSTESCTCDVDENSWKSAQGRLGLLKKMPGY